MMMRQRTIVTVMAGLVLGSAAAAGAQSLDAKRPQALAAGENTGTVDSMVGPQFWQFQSKKGSAAIIVRFTSMGLLGNSSAATVQIVLHDATGKTFGSESVTSNGKAVEVKWPGTFAKPGAVIVEVRPPMSSLVRTGGDYSITVTGAVDYAHVKVLGPERIAGTYTLMVCPPALDCQAVRFFPNGSVKAADGTAGTWSSFDPSALVYSVKIGSATWSLKLVPGRGLVDTANTAGIVFQSVRNQHREVYVFFTGSGRLVFKEKISPLISGLTLIVMVAVIALSARALSIVTVA